MFRSWLFWKGWNYNVFSTLHWFELFPPGSGHTCLWPIWDICLFHCSWSVPVMFLTCSGRVPVMLWPCSGYVVAGTAGIASFAVVFWPLETPCWNCTTLVLHQCPDAMCLQCVVWQCYCKVLFEMFGAVFRPCSSHGYFANGGITMSFLHYRYIGLNYSGLVPVIFVCDQFGIFVCCIVFEAFLSCSVVFRSCCGHVLVTLLLERLA